MAAIKKKKPAAKATAKESAKAKPTKAKPKQEPKARPKSLSGKYKSIRHLLETLFFKNKDITKEEAKAIVKKEFPTASYLRTNKTHFSWYKSHIVGHGTFLTIDPPAWVKGGPKIKKAVRNANVATTQKPTKEEHSNGKEGADVQEGDGGSEGRVQGSKGHGKRRVPGAQDRAEGRVPQHQGRDQGRVRQRQQEEGQEEGQEEKQEEKQEGSRRKRVVKKGEVKVEEV